jgi:type IV pilus assembly protein PilE
MMATAQYLERCFTQTNSYTGCTRPNAAAADGYYNISMTEYTDTTYEIQAVPQGSQEKDPCGTFTLDYLGNKNAGSTSARCWGDN